MNGFPPMFTMPFGAPVPFRDEPEELADDLDDTGLGSDGEGDSLDQVDGAGGPKRKSRRPPSTAEKRANHNAIERARRESLNGRFMELARALPTMAANKRPSKNAIVLKSLEYVQSTRYRESALEAQNTALRNEVNELRAKLGMAPRSEPLPLAQLQAAARREADKSRAAVKKEAVTYGFPTSAPSQLTTFRSSTGPYLPQDPITAAYYGFVDPNGRRPSMASLGTSNGSPRDEASDSDASLVHTPPSIAGFAAPHAGPYYYEDTGLSSMPRSLGSNYPTAADAELYACTSAPPSAGLVPASRLGRAGWPTMANPGMGIAAYPAASSLPYSLYA